MGQILRQVVGWFGRLKDKLISGTGLALLWLCLFAGGGDSPGCCDGTSSDYYRSTSKPDGCGGEILLALGVIVAIILLLALLGSLLPPLPTEKKNGQPPPK